MVPLRCTDFATMYGVRMTTIGPYRVFAYLSIPAGEGPFPAVYYVARYGSVVEPIPQGAANFNRSRFVTLSIAARGQRNADQPFAAQFPGMLTHGIEDKTRFVFRGVAADCARGLEYLLSHPQVDQARVVLVGNDLALVAASLGQGATHVVSAPELFYDTVALASRTSAYPLQEVNDYLRLNPHHVELVRDTLSYFDLRWFAPGVASDVLLSAHDAGGLLNPHALDPLVDALPGRVTVHESENSSYKDGLYVEQWIARECGFEGPILPEHWQP